MQRSMSWRFEGRLAIVLHGPKNPSNLEWQRMLIEEASHGQPENGRTLIVSYGGGPDGHQRELLAKKIGGMPNPTCIMTKSAIVRAITSALLFFNRNMKVVGLEDRASCYEFLGLSSEERDRADRVRRELELELGLADQRSLEQRL